MSKSSEQNKKQKSKDYNTRKIITPLYLYIKSLTSSGTECTYVASLTFKCGLKPNVLHGQSCDASFWISPTHAFGIVRHLVLLTLFPLVWCASSFSHEEKKKTQTSREQNRTCCLWNAEELPSQENTDSDARICRNLLAPVSVMREEVYLFFHTIHSISLNSSNPNFCHVRR